MMESEERPEFKRGKTTTRSVRLSKDMLKAAEKKARQEKIRTGGSFNSLVEWLIWQYLDRDAKFIEPVRNEEKNE